MIILSLIWKRWKYYRRRSGYLTLGLSLTFILLTVVSGASFNYTSEVSSLFTPYKGKIVIIQKGALFAEGLPLNSQINLTKLDFLWNYPHTTGGVLVNVERLDSKIESDLLLGITPFGKLPLDPFLYTCGLPLSEGRLPVFYNQEIVIGKKTSLYLDEKKSIEDIYQIRGINVTIVGTLATKKLIQSHYILMYNDLFNNITLSDNIVNMVILEPDSTSEEDIEREVELQYPFLEVLTEDERNEISAEILSVVEGFTSLVAVVSFGVSLLFVYSLTNLTLSERFKELGTLKSLGHKASAIMIELILETLLSTICSIGFGIIGTIGIVSLWVSTTEGYAKIINLVPIEAYIVSGIAIIVIAIFGTTFGSELIRRKRPNELLSLIG